MRDTKKILLLTLGTGRLSDTNEAEYISVQYTFEGQDYKKNIDDIEGQKQISWQNRLLIWLSRMIFISLEQ